MGKKQTGPTSASAIPGKIVQRPQAGTRGNGFDAVIGRYFETRADEVRFDACQAQPAARAWILLPPP
jgi:hypothetical protein